MGHDDDVRADLRLFLDQARDALVWKLDGLGEYDARRPVTPTGTNLLGLLKHAANLEMGYLGLVFDQPFPDPPAWFGTVDPLVDMWATAEESRADLLDLHRRARDHADATIDALPLDAPGRVPWWPPDRAGVTLHRVVLHLTADLVRHAGHADVLRELVDGAVGLRPDRSNLPDGDATFWSDHRRRVERAARDAPA